MKYFCQINEICVYLPLFRVADTPFHIQGDEYITRDILLSIYECVAGVHYISHNS